MSQERAPLKTFEQRSDFIRRHIGPDDASIAEMLNTLGMGSLDELVAKTVPAHIQSDVPLSLGEAHTEREILDRARELAGRNRVCKSMIGMGYSDCITPPVILRNILEDPGWYTAYTPYQAEISQGRMEALLNFQTMITDLTGMEMANASLLDEGTAAAEAMSLCLAVSKKKERSAFWVSRDCHPQTIEVVQTRAHPLDIDIIVGDPQSISFDDDATFAILLQYPTTTGSIEDYTEIIEKAHDAGVLAVVASDLLGLTLLKPPGELGADVVVGNSQRFGVPLGFGGPHAAFLATRDAFKRQAPGRVIGVSVDSHGDPAVRLALQTREQHIRREKATSNICTSQVLLAVMASMYAVYHGPGGLTTIARRVHRLASIFAEGLNRLGMPVRESAFFDTVSVSVPDADEVMRRAVDRDINLRRVDAGTVGVTVDETTTAGDLETLWRAFAGREDLDLTVDALDGASPDRIPDALRRRSEFLTHEVFNSHHSETEMLRYMHHLEERDVTLTRSMIPLGSCTMKLNATTEMIPISFPGFSSIHPFAPLDQVPGYLELIREFEGMLADITGFSGVSLQPNAGSQGEYAGLLVIRRYHESRGEGHRSICLIPSSAHGTNPASATMAGMKVVVVGCDSDGNIDIEDMEAKATQHADDLAALMITYPSTHGVFEEGIRTICEIVHRSGGQVYLDGANLNALMGLCLPGRFGADVAHLNLHKTFCIPHGGGGPGVGPIGVCEHLEPFLPTHSVVPGAGPDSGISAVSAAPWGSAGILPISWAFIALMGADGIRKSAQVAILNANYVAARLAPHYNVLYKGLNGLVAHECIIDVRPLRDSAGITVDDFAKRLMDFGFHAPTMSWPVAGTLMIEPTESESKQELDRFCDAMIHIREEVRAIEDGRIDRDNNALKHAPHTAADVTQEGWDRPYTRHEAAFPLPWVKTRKFWPPVGRVDNKYGDRNFFCTCPPPESYA